MMSSAEVPHVYRTWQGAASAGLTLWAKGGWAACRARGLHHNHLGVPGPARDLAFVAVSIDLADICSGPRDIAGVLLRVRAQPVRPAAVVLPEASSSAARPCLDRIHVSLALIVGA